MSGVPAGLEKSSRPGTWWPRRQDDPAPGHARDGPSGSGARRSRVPGASHPLRSQPADGREFIHAGAGATSDAFVTPDVRTGNGRHRPGRSIMDAGRSGPADRARTSKLRRMAKRGRSKVEHWGGTSEDQKLAAARLVARLRQLGSVGCDVALGGTRVTTGARVRRVLGWRSRRRPAVWRRKPAMSASSASVLPAQI